MNWEIVFDTEEIFQIVGKAHHADEGLKQNIEKLENYHQKIGN